MGRVRIISGELKGRRIDVVDEDGLRPTPERVREALFSILGDRVGGATVLDAYAGTGALGFEALSRGARYVLFADASSAVARALERSRAALGCLDRSRIVQGDLPALFDRGALAGPFDLIFTDPPYGKGERRRFLETVSHHRPLASGGMLVVESEARKSAADETKWPHLEHRRRAVYGRSALDFYVPAAAG